ncbi:hypothetical protein FACS189454_05250 [Planctomycetales bacterium]|nr:hypothetical protein FACS189454_05250 [Planctomycetales bacterium]
MLKLRIPPLPPPPPQFAQSLHINTQVQRLEILLGADDPVVVQLTVDNLVQHQKFENALHILQKVPDDRKTRYLKGLEKHLQNRQSNADTEAAIDVADPVVQAQWVTRLLKAEKWDFAIRRLEKLEKLLTGHPNNEVAALCYLYRGMILAESGVARFNECYPLFAEANRRLDILAKESSDAGKSIAQSRFDAANNCGEYLSRLARYRLSNSSLALGTGDTSVFTDALMAWSLALDMYGKALRIAESSLADQPMFAATARLNLARLYSLRGDIVRTIEQGKEDTGIIAAVVSIEDMSFEKAEELTQQIVNLKLDDDRLNGAAHHLLANIAYRQKDYGRCRNEAAIARKCYVQIGKISSIEFIERLFANTEIADTSAELRHLLISDALSEIQRELIPEDEIGLNRAGFMARRASGKERLIELLIKENRPAEALAILETAKSRSLQDVLSNSTMKELNKASNYFRSVENIIADFPKDTAAVEYFIGRKKCWGFLVLNGQIKAFPIEIRIDNDSSQKLVELVQQSLQQHFAGTEEQRRSGKLWSQTESERLKKGEGFRRKWQDDLYQLRSRLIPDTILAEIREAKPENLLVIPHHVLHYFPFASLVVEKDENKDRQKMPQPRFLLEEDFNIFYAPSLTGWDTIRNRKSESFKDVSAVGISEFANANNLDGVKKDMTNIQTVFGKEKVTLFSENRATKPALEETLKNRGLLLIATHGQNDSAYPLNSFLMLRTEDGNDDYMTAGELFYSTVRSNIVVLSACYSGLAEKSPMPGDDLFGIQRALLRSGAGSVIAGVWDVYDSTGPLIVEGLMKNLAAGKPVAAALAESQREFLKQQRKEGAENPWTHPYFWAVYTLTGNGNVRYEP